MADCSRSSSIGGAAGAAIGPRGARDVASGECRAGHDVALERHSCAATIYATADLQGEGSTEETMAIVEHVGWGLIVTA